MNIPITSKISRHLAASNSCIRGVATSPKARSVQLSYLRLLGAVFEKPVSELAVRIPAKRKVPDRQG